MRYVDWRGYKFAVDKTVFVKGEIGIIRICERIADEEKAFVDIGASVGEYAIQLAKFFKHVYAFEPNPPVYRCLSENIRINGLSNVTAYNLALSNYVGHSKLHDCGVGSRLEEVGEIEGTSYVDVKVDTLDRIVFEKRDEDCPIGLIKIDTEGAELFVLEGAMKTIRTYKPDLIIEYHDEKYEDAPKTKKVIFKLLHDMGYVPILLRDRHYLHTPYDRFVKEFDKYKHAVICNVLCTLIENLKNGRDWYYGIPKTWWWGMIEIDFIYALDEFVDLDFALEIVKKNVNRTLSEGRS